MAYYNSTHSGLQLSSTRKVTTLCAATWCTSNMAKVTFVNRMTSPSWYYPMCSSSSSAQF